MMFDLSIATIWFSLSNYPLRSKEWHLCRYTHHYNNLNPFPGSVSLDNEKLGTLWVWNMSVLSRNSAHEFRKLENWFENAVEPVEVEDEFTDFEILFFEII